MSIHPLPVFEADVDPHHREALTDEEIYDRLKPPDSMVVRFGYMKLIGEYPYDGDAKPGCGSKIVARTHRGTELTEMLTTTCANAGCSKSVTRQEMLEYIDNSGGKDFPFYTDGRILRVATVEDLNAQSALDSVKREGTKTAKELIRELNLPMKLVEVEPILGGELLTFFYKADERVDFREMVKRLASHFKTRIEMRQVGARDEARLVADYERCGQYCCCKNFLKVLKPVSMKSAKNQNRPLDALKISGRCGRLMCCLRYEDETYKDLRKRLPRRNTRVGTTEGPGVVVDSKLLVQLVLVKLDFDAREVAVPVEELMDPDECPRPGASPEEVEAAEAKIDPMRGMSREAVESRTGDRKGRDRDKHTQQDAYREKSRQFDESDEQPAEPGEAQAKPKTPESGDRTDQKSGQPSKKKRRGRRGGKKRRGKGKGPGDTNDTKNKQGGHPSKGGPSTEDGGGGKSKRRRGRRGGRGRRGKGKGQGGNQSGGGGGGNDS